ncbi:Hypothetical protein YggS, proline synthase co-transcribed bacterial homolog PROSC [Mycetocola reblochoni REB411]|uniref:Pyridoxal phosphate homeostasis protein n=1 Tax=Mycetocola reblochoni REB411 TaxID=1255698 RepID=A0A1R4J7A7_9MICO|nr:Hypothetical protein YggS, proline synthase co-transcribed bacterial homolog PROSC [Mycetocola reblochoni REB411]
MAERLADVRQRVSAAARLAGRDPSELTTIAVTKFHPASLVRELAEAGLLDVGENREQEATAKSQELEDLDLRWHFIGQLQSKKARRVQRFSRWIHSLDRESLRTALAHDDGPSTSVFIQVNLTSDPGRGGLSSGELSAFADRVAGTPGLDLVGVMGVAPLDEEPRRAFARLKALSDALVRSHPGAASISAGMSADFEDAIAEGATHLRIGSAITGNRPERR